MQTTILMWMNISEETFRRLNWESNEEDAEELSILGVGKLFGPGTPVKESLDYIESWVKEHRR